MIKDCTILGIDPGTNILGYGVVSVVSGKPRYLDMGVFDLRKLKDPYDKLANINAGVEELIAVHKPDHLAVESPFYGKNAQVILKLGRAQGAAIIAAAKQGISVHEYAPRRAKIAICGNGAASKEQVALMVGKTLGIKIEGSFLDATDAIALAMCHYYTLSNPASSVSRSASSWEAFIKENPGRIK